MAVCEAGDWVLDSLDRYERLHVFELEEPTLCMEWSHDSTAIFVAGFSREKHNELLQLLLPEKLLPVDKQTLLARRDFKIGRGALSEWPVHHIKSVDQTKNVIATSGLRPELTVWDSDPGSPDLLVATSNIATPAPTLGDPHNTELLMSWSPGQPHTLVSGSSQNTLQVTDLNTCRPVWTSLSEASEDQGIHALECLLGESHVFITCSDGGELSLWDSRLADGGSLKFPSTPTPQGATSGGSVAGARHGMAVCGGKCATLVWWWRLEGLRQTWSGPRFLETSNEEAFIFSQSVHVSERSANQTFSESSNQLSVSGPGKGVAVYDIISLTNDITSPSPVFVHGGHEADSSLCEVTVHSWHPSFHAMILSCDSEGTMHAWQWRKEKA